MRVILVIVLVLLLALLGLPYWFGMQTEKTYNEITEDYSASEHLTIVGQEYQRGWLDSRAKTTFVLQNDDNELIKLEESDTIYHGPIPLGLLFEGKSGIMPVMAVLKSRVALVPVKESEYSDIINQLPPVNMITTLSLDGKGTTNISMPGMDTTPGGDGEKLQWSGLEGVVTFSQDFKEVGSTLQSAGLKLEGKDIKLSISDIQGDSKLNYKTEGYQYPTGEGVFTIKEITVLSIDEETGKEDNIAVKDIEISGSSDVSNGAMDSTHSLGFREFEVGGNKYGPGIYELSVRNIDIASWTQIQALVKESREGEQTEESNEKFMAELVKVLPSLIKKSPEIELTKLSVATDKGGLEGHAVISVDGSNLGDPELAANPLFLITAVKASARVSVSKPLLESALTDYHEEEISDGYAESKKKLPPEEEIREMAEKDTNKVIKGLIDQNILTSSGDNYEASASYEMGQVILNGQPLDLDSLMNQ